MPYGRMKRISLHYIISLLTTLMLALAATGCHSSRTTATHSKDYNRTKPAVKQHIDIDRDHLAQPSVAVLSEANKWLGVPYKYGGETRSGIDCSALVQNVFRSSLSIHMPRSSSKQADYCKTIKRDQVIEGDLLFFSTPGSGNIGHVGIYIGNGCMIHASSSRGVVVSNISDDYFTRHFLKAGRVEAYYAMVEKRKKKSGKPKAAEPLPPVEPEPPIEPEPPLIAEAEPAPAPAPVPVAVATPTPVVSPKPATPVAVAPTPVAVGKGEAKKTEALSTREARLRVIKAFSEQPADSVLTPYFE